MKIKVVFLGNPNISVNALKSLHQNESIDVVSVVTYEDKAIGRSHSNLKPTPVAQYAEDNNINIIKTNSINTDVNKLKELGEFDYLLTCAFGQFLNDEVLATPSKKALNVHASLLPKGRGGAPIHWAIIEGEKETGVSMMEMVSEMDAGDYYVQDKIEISETETFNSLYEKLSVLIEETTANNIIKVYDGAKAIKQGEEVSFWMNVSKEDAKLDFNKTNREVYNKIRGLDSIPGAWTTINGNVIKVHSSVIVDQDNGVEPGTIFSIDREGVLVQCKEGSILIKEVTLPGKKRNSIENIYNGNIPFEKDNKFEM